MAAHLRDNVLHGKDHPGDHTSANRWRHEESRSFARHAVASPRKADERNESKDLADFLNSTRVEPPKSSGSAATKSKPIMIAGNSHSVGAGVQSLSAQRTAGGGATHANTGTMEVKCGPLLNYRRMENETWHGSVLIVTKGGGLVEGPAVPDLRWRILGPERTSAPVKLEGLAGAGNEVYRVVNGVDNSSSEGPESPSPSPLPSNGVQEQGTIDSGSISEDVKVKGTKLYSDPSNTFWRFDLKVPMQQSELNCEYDIPGLSFLEGKKRDRQSFFIPAISKSMRIMFHSCNGFSVGTDEKAWSGAALWNDVIRVHNIAPFHVMLGGGDQIYNDGIRVKGPLRAWTDIGNPKKRRDYPFTEELRKDCDKYYADNYIRWYSTEPFATANGQIPQLNLWDDHDIIDGFGSYVDDFMRCAVFRGIGGTASKYYLLFQHHLAPPVATYTTDAVETTSDEGAVANPRQLENTFVLQEDSIDPSYIIGSKPGPYVAEHSRSIYARLGARIGFFGIDARTERTRKQVNYPETYDIIFDRLRKELEAAKSSPSPIEHLIVLLGIPIAYPRLTWLENIFSSPFIAPVKFLNKRFGFGGNFFNHFDGSIDLLDDLDDHYTARTHKKERLYLVEQLQALSAAFSVRITILGGDVHLAAVGRFYSNPKLNVPISQDHRYMANIISSAIVNKPPPQAVANLLARRNKIHHLDPNTDETLMKFFDKDPGNSNKGSSWNHVTMPSRNFAMITENHEAPVGTHDTAPNDDTRTGTNGAADLSTEPIPKVKDGHGCLHQGEVNAGSKHKAADMEKHGKGSDGSLDICIRVEMDQHDKEGKTELYGMTIPVLVYDGAADKVLRKRDAIQGAFHQKV